MRKYVLTFVCALGLISSGTLAALADWMPPGPVKIMIGFRAGGGADTQARLIAEGLNQAKGWEFIPVNVTGKGGLNLLKELSGEPNDGTVIGMVVTESLGYNLVAAGVTEFGVDDFTPILTTAGFQIGIVSLSDSPWQSWDDVVTAAKSGQSIRFGTMSPRLSDLAYLIGKAADIEFNIVELTGGRAVMDALNAGDIDIGWGAGIQTRDVLAGDKLNIVSGLDVPLDASPDAPTMADIGVPFTADGYFLLVAPKGLSSEARSAYAEAIKALVSDSSSQVGTFINNGFGGPSIIEGAELDALVNSGVSDAEALLNASAE